MNEGSGKLIINLSQLTSNIQKLKNICPSNKIIFMIKSNAYGHGMIPIVKYCLEKKENIEFGVASFLEGASLVKSISQINLKIIVFSDPNIRCKDAIFMYQSKKLIPVISNFDDLLFFISNKDYKNVPLYLKFNTGMNRLGIRFSQMDDVVKILKEHKRGINHLMSHFSSAFLPMKENKQTKRQLELFEKIKERFKQENIEVLETSISNSGAIEQRIGLEETHIRPGLMLYGTSALLSNHRSLSCWNGSLISSFRSKVLDTFQVKKGTPIGYGAHPIFEDGRLAILGIGYGDGLFEESEGFSFFSGEQSLKIIGKVNMDMCYAFYSSSKKLKPGEDIVFWSDNDFSQLDSFSSYTGKSFYKIFCSIGVRVSRIYKYE